MVLFEKIISPVSVSLRHWQRDDPNCWDVHLPFWARLICPANAGKSPNSHAVTRWLWNLYAHKYDEITSFHGITLWHDSMTNNIPWLSNDMNSPSFPPFGPSFHAGWVGHFTCTVVESNFFRKIPTIWWLTPPHPKAGAWKKKIKAAVFFPQKCQDVLYRWWGSPGWFHHGFQGLGLEVWLQHDFGSRLQVVGIHKIQILRFAILSLNFPRFPCWFPDSVGSPPHGSFEEHLVMNKMITQNRKSKNVWT